MNNHLGLEVSCYIFFLPKIHKRLYNVPVRPVISNYGFYTDSFIFGFQFTTNCQKSQVIYQTH